ncbi:MAG: hypothetical protein ACXWLM_09145 [Myxococcales bacterium]
MLRANQAVRLGLRAASRNPELAFARALLDQGGNLIALLPVLLAGFCVAAVAFGASIPAALSALFALRWTVLGGVLTAFAIAFVAGMVFWAGALPLLAADAEMDRRPPPGNFAVLASRGFARVLGAGAIAYGLSLLFALAATAAMLAAIPLAIVGDSPSVLFGGALVAAAAIGGSVVIDLLGRLLLVRTAALGDGIAAGFGKAASLLATRLGACLLVTAAFLFLELIAATAMGMATGFLSGSDLFDPDAQLLAIAPRIAAGLAAAVVFAWLEVGRMGALAALAADAEGLIEPHAQPPPPPAAEPVIEALPAPDAPE